MQRLSATECITPAIDRTKLLLFSPFRKGRTWKLCATSYVCRIGSMYLPLFLLYLPMLPGMRQRSAALIPVITGLVVIGLAIYTWIFHLASRLQFAYFDMVANRGEFVAPAWRNYRAQVFSWTVFKIVLGTIFTAITSVPFAAWLRHMIPLMRHMTPAQPGGQLDPQFARMMASFYAGYGITMLLIFSGMLIFGLLGDFVVPSLALEDTGLREAFRRMGVLMRQDPGEFALYVLLKTVLGFVAYMGAIMAWEIAFLLVSLIVGALVFFAGFLLHLAGLSSVLLGFLGGLVLMVWCVFTIYTMVFPIGIVMTWMDAYAIYFLGGRYPKLGDMVDAATPPSLAPALNPYVPAYPPPLPPTA
jgi:hypothetical protein